MSVKPTIQLCIAQLFQPLSSWQKDFLFEPLAPHLSQLLCNFHLEKNEGIQGLDNSLFGALRNATGIEGSAELPFAQTRFLIHKNIDVKPPKMLLCADPSHLEVGMNDITLTDKITDLSDEESQELIADLNQHFKQDGIAFIFGSNRHWYIALPDVEAVSSTPLDQALRQNIAQLLPQSNARNWQIILNESQMILHASKVNQQREIAGMSTVNSLWFWGGGQAEKYNTDNMISGVFYNHSDDSKTRAQTIARAVNCDYHILPKTHEMRKVISKEGKSILIFDQLFLPAIHDDLDQFQQALTKLDEEIIKPLKELWQQGEIELLIDGCDGQIFKPSKPSVLKFWKKKSIALTELAKR